MVPQLRGEHTRQAHAETEAGQPAGLGQSLPCLVYRRVVEVAGLRERLRREQLVDPGRLRVRAAADPSPRSPSARKNIRLVRHATSFGSHRSATLRSMNLSLKNPRSFHRGWIFAMYAITSSSRNAYRVSTDEFIATRSPLLASRCPGSITRPPKYICRLNGCHRCNCSTGISRSSSRRPRQDLFACRAGKEPEFVSG